MNFEQGRYRYIINRDWLSFSVRALRNVENLQFRVPHFLSYEECKGTNSYAKRAIVTDRENNKVLTLLWQPYSRIIDRQLVFVEIGNSYLYGKLENALYLLETMFEFDYGNISRYDICYDFNPYPRQLTTIRRLATKECYIQRYNDSGVFWDGNMPKQVSFGNPTSMVKLKCYNKTKELRVGSQDIEKPYIVNEWKEFNMDIFNMWRFEISMSSMSSILYGNKSVSIRDVLSDEKMAEMFISIYTDRVHVKHDDGKSRRSDNSDVDFLRVPDIDTLKYVKKESKESRKNVMYAREIMHLVREIDESKVIKGDDRLLRKYIDPIMMMRNADVDRYIKNVYGIVLSDVIEDWLFGSSTSVKYYGG